MFSNKTINNKKKYDDQIWKIKKIWRGMKLKKNSNFITYSR